MTVSDVDLIVEFLGPALDKDGQLDMANFIGAPENVARGERLIHPEAPVEFVTPDGGFIGGMEGPWRGAEGLRAGFGEWLEPWEEWRISVDDVTSAPQGRVLLLGKGSGKMAGSGLEVEAPLGALYEIRDGMIASIRHFLDQDQAKAEAGLAG
jgi:ketosteroid isomerase-like protein